MFRIVQEAFNNVARHSGADSVVLDLHGGETAITLAIEDNGRGFAEGAAAPGMGLANMRERALLSGGTFALQTNPGEGTRLTFAWPTGGG